MPWDDDQTSSDDITATEWNNMVDVIKNSPTNAKFLITQNSGGDYIVIDSNKDIVHTETTSTSAQTAFNHAYNNLPANGGLVLVAEGTYTVDGSITPSVGSKTVGAGMKNTLIQPNSALDVFSIASNNVEVADLEVDANGNGGKATSSVISGFSVAADDIELDSVASNGDWASAIYLDGCDNIVIQNCECIGATTPDGNASGQGYSISTWHPDSTDVGQTTNLRILNCEIANSGGSIAPYNVDGFQIIGNYLHDGKTAITCSPARNGVIADNICDNHPSYTTSNEGPIQVEYTSSHATTGVAAGVPDDTSHDVTVKGNIISNAGEGIAVDDNDSQNPYSIIIQNNTVRNSDTGVLIANSDYIGVLGNNLRANSTQINIDTGTTTNITQANNIQN